MRRERDSNPRYALGVYTLSRRASSTTRASLQYVCNLPSSQNGCKLQKKSHLQTNECTNLKFLLDIRTTLRLIILILRKNKLLYLFINSFK